MCVHMPIQRCKILKFGCAQNSNIVEFVGLLKKDDSSKQMVYYQVCAIHSIPSNPKPSDHYFTCQSGIGTFTTPKYSASRFASNISQVNGFLQLFVDANADIFSK